MGIYFIKECKHHELTVGRANCILFYLRELNFVKIFDG